MSKLDTSDALLLVGLLLVALFMWQSYGWQGLLGLVGGLCVAFAFVLAQRGARRG